MVVDGQVIGSFAADFAFSACFAFAFAAFIFFGTGSVASIADFLFIGAILKSRITLPRDPKGLKLKSE